VPTLLEHKATIDSFFKTIKKLMLFYRQQYNKLFIKHLKINFWW